MNKMLSRIAIAIASFAMVVGGAFGVATLNSKNQTKPAYAENGDVAFTFESERVVNLVYQKWERFGWSVSWGGDYCCGLQQGNWKTFEEQGYAKYVDGTVVTPDRYGWVAATTEPHSFIGDFDFNTTTGYTYGHIYLTYSTDGETYTLVPFTEGSQGAVAIGNSVQSFNFDSIRRAYYAIVVVSENLTPPNGSFLFHNVVCNFYEKIDPLGERITVSGNNTVYVDEDIELTTTAYNYSPSEYTWVSSDPSVATITNNGSTAVIHGVGKGTTYITVSTMGTNGIVYTDPLEIKVKKFDFTRLDDGIELNPGETKRFLLDFEDENGNVRLTCTSEDTNIITARTNNSRSFLVTAGSIGGVSTTLTVTLKDNNGAEGCHVTSRTIQVTVKAFPILGERLMTKYDPMYVYLATFDGEHFIKVVNNKLGVTNNIEEATIFNISGAGICYYSLSDNQYRYIFYNGGSFKWGSDSALSVTDSYNDYPGLLKFNNYFMFYQSDTSVIPLSFNNLPSLEESRGVNPNNVFFAYAADDPGHSIVPQKSSVSLLKGESIDISARVAFVDSVEYEIISGASSIEQLTVSEIDNQNHINIHIETSDTRGTAIIRIRDANDDSVYTDITVRVKMDAETEVTNLSTQTSLAYHYSKDELGNFTYSDASIRFGARIDKDLWNEIDEDYDIAGFGLMITGKPTNSLIPEQAYLIKQHVDEAVLAESATDLDTELVDHYMSINEMAVPPESNNDYAWNLMQAVAISNVVDVTKEYTTAAYIKLLSGEYIFFDQVRTSVYNLASSYLNSDEYDSDTAEGSLQHLVDMVGIA